MGFSLVSAFEIVYHCMLTLCWKSFHFYRRKTMRTFPSKAQQDNLQQPKGSNLAPNSNANPAVGPETLTWQEIGSISQNLGPENAQNNSAEAAIPVVVTSEDALEDEEVESTDDGGRPGNCPN